MSGTLLTVALDGPEHARLRLAIASATGCILRPARASVAPSDTDRYLDEMERLYGPELSARLGKHLPATLAALRRLHRERMAMTALLTDTPDLRGIVLGCDTVGGARALAQASVPTFLVPHAIMPRVRFPRRWHGGTAFARTVCAAGPFSAAMYRESGATVVETGMPRWDGYATLNRAQAKAAAIGALGLDPSRPIVVYAGTWLERNSAHATRHVPALWQIYRDVCRAAREANAQLVVKLHPGEIARCGGNTFGLITGYTQVARSHGLSEITVTAEHKEGLLCAADVVVGMTSNLAFEALLCGTPVVNVPLVPEDAEAFFDHGSLRRPEDVHEALCPMLADRVALRRLGRASETIVSRFVHQPDGHAAERVAAVVADGLKS